MICVDGGQRLTHGIKSADAESMADVVIVFGTSVNVYSSYVVCVVLK